MYNKSSSLVANTYAWRTRTNKNQHKMDPTDVTPETAARRKSLVTAHDTHAIAAFMSKVSGGSKTHRGYENWSVMSNDVKRATIYYFSVERGSRFPILHINTRSYTHAWSGTSMWGQQWTWFQRMGLSQVIDSQRPARCVILFNDRHLVTCRECPNTGEMLILDTTHDELPHGTERILAYLNETQALSPPKELRVVRYDHNTIQQPIDCGGCCVMALCNFVLQDGSYATVEQGEALRRRMGMRVMRDMLRGVTLPDMVRRFNLSFECYV